MEIYARTPARIYLLVSIVILETVVTGFFIGWMGMENGTFEYSYLMKLEDDWQKTKSKTISKIRKWIRRRKFKAIK